MRFISYDEQQFIFGCSNHWNAISVLTGIGAASGALVGTGLSIYKKDIRILPISVALGMITGFLILPYFQAAANG